LAITLGAECAMSNYHQPSFSLALRIRQIDPVMQILTQNARFSVLGKEQSSA